MTDLKSPSRPRSSAGPIWAIMLILAVLVSLATGEQTRRLLFDTWQRLSPRPITANNVRVVLIDGKSLDLVGAWPWSRYYLARLTEGINRQGAKVIAYDMLFPEEDRARPELFAKLYPELRPAVAREIYALPSMDEVFGQVIGRSPVVIARAGASEGVRDGSALTVDAQIAGSLPRHVDSWPAAVTAIPELEDVALGHGLINGPPDPDGTVRAVPMVMRVSGRPMPGFALEVARIGLGAQGFRVSHNNVELAGRKIRIDDRGRMHFRFGDFPTRDIASAAAVLGNAVPGDYFRSKIVIIGLAAEGTSDIVSTPLASQSFGAVVQAEAVDAILDGGWISRPPWVAYVEWGLAALLALLALAVRAGSAIPRIALVVAFVAVPTASWAAFDSFNLLIDAIRPLEIGSAALAGMIVGLFADARRERERLRNALVREQLLAAKTEGELQAARVIQMSMVPQRSELAMVDPRLDADALLEPARSVGGDLFDLARLDENRVSFFIGDVTGKGVPAALYMAMSKALTSFVLSRHNADLATAVADVNEELMRGGVYALSVTAIIGIIDLRTGFILLVCAGHEDPITVDAQGKAKSHRLEGGPPLGLDNYPYPVEELILAPGETLVLVTDGITEAQDRGGALFGRKKVIETVAGNPGNATELCERLRNAIRSFEGGIEPTDDLTVMALRLRSPSARSLRRGD